MTMYTQSQLVLFAAAQLVTQVKAYRTEEGVFRGGVTQRTENAWDALLRWYKENGIEEPTPISYGWYRVEKEQLVAVAHRELTPLPYIDFLLPQ